MPMNQRMMLAKNKQQKQHVAALAGNTIDLDDLQSNPASALGRSTRACKRNNRGIHSMKNTHHDDARTALERALQLGIDWSKIDANKQTKDKQDKTVAMRMPDQWNKIDNIPFQDLIWGDPDL